MRTVWQRIRRCGSSWRTGRFALRPPGSIAEAAIQVNGVFEAAQAAADQYLASVKAATAEMVQKTDEAQRQREAIMQDAKQQAGQIVQDAQAQADRILAEAGAPG